MCFNNTNSTLPSTVSPATFSSFLLMLETVNHSPTELLYRSRFFPHTSYQNHNLFHSPTMQHNTDSLYSHFSFPLTIIHGSLCSFSSSWSSWFLLFWLMSNDALSFYLVLIVDPHVDHLGVGFIRSFTRPPNANDAPMHVLDR